MRSLFISILLIIFLNCERDLSGIYEKNYNLNTIDTVFISWATFAGVDQWWGAVGDGWYNAPPFMTCDHIFDDDFFLLYQYKSFNFSSILKTTSNPYVFALSILTKK